MASLTESYVKTRRWRRAEYEHLVALGVFVGDAHGWRYRSVETPATITPLAAPRSRVRVADLFP